jgi:hypothetical protein
MSNTIRTRKASALIEDTGIAWSVKYRRMANTAAMAMMFSALAACGVQNDAASVSDLAAFQEMSIPAWNSKDDCDKAAALAGNSLNGDAQELTFSCDSVDTKNLEKADNDPTATSNSLATAPTAAASAPSSSHASSGSNPLLWYMLGNMMSNRTSVASTGFAPSTGTPASSAFINSAGGGKMTMSADPKFPSPTPSQYAGLKTNGGVVNTSIIGSNVARAASYKTSTSSIGSKSSARSSVGHSHGGGGGGGGG